MPDEKSNAVIELLNGSLQIAGQYLHNRRQHTAGRLEVHLTVTQTATDRGRPSCPYALGPDDVRGEHGGQVDGRHLVDLLVASGVVEQVQQQLQQAAVGRRQQHEEQLEGLDLPLLVGDAGLVALVVEAGQR